MNKPTTYRTCLGADKPLKNFRIFKKELKKLITINPTVLNLLRKKEVMQYTAGRTQRIKIKGFMITYEDFGDYRICIRFCYSIPDYKEDYVTSSMPSDYRMQLDYHSPNYIFIKD